VLPPQVRDRRLFNRAVAIMIPSGHPSATEGPWTKRVRAQPAVREGAANTCAHDGWSRPILVLRLYRRFVYITSPLLRTTSKEHLIFSSQYYTSSSRLSVQLSKIIAAPTCERGQYCTAHRPPLYSPSSRVTTCLHALLGWRFRPASGGHAGALFAR